MSHPPTWLELILRWRQPEDSSRLKPFHFWPWCSIDNQTFRQWSLWPALLARRFHPGKQVSCTWLLRQARRQGINMLFLPNVPGSRWHKGVMFLLWGVRAKWSVVHSRHRHGKTSDRLKMSSFQSFSPNLSDFWISFFSQAFQDQILAVNKAKLLGGFNPVEKYMLAKLDHLRSYRGKHKKYVKAPPLKAVFQSNISFRTPMSEVCFIRSYPLFSMALQETVRLK